MPDTLNEADSAAAAVAKAPRVTLEQLEAKIVAEAYLRGDCSEVHVTGPIPAPGPETLAFNASTIGPLSCLTICVLVMQNGFTITGESACASPENYDEALGQRFAREAAIRKAWEFEGYLLREQVANPPAVMVVPTDEAAAALSPGVGDGKRAAFRGGLESLQVENAPELYREVLDGARVLIRLGREATDPAVREAHFKTGFVNEAFALERLRSVGIDPDRKVPA